MMLRNLLHRFLDYLKLKQWELARQREVYRRQYEEERIIARSNWSHMSRGRKILLACVCAGLAVVAIVLVV